VTATPLDYGEIAELLAASPEYRVLRMFAPRAMYGVVADPRLALFVDVESTGLNTDEDKIIQFGAVLFEYDASGAIGSVQASYSSREDPGVPLSREIVEVTGLTDAQLKGQRINDESVAALLSDVSLVIAHNADFDRRMIERRFTGFDRIPWACSQRDVDWKRFGCQYIGLEFLLMKSCGEFFLPHDALDDCRVGLHILATPRADDRSPFSYLIDSVNTPTLRLWAWQSPFATKDRLRLRRFRWDGDRRCWWKDLKPEQLADEQEWLLEHVYAGDPDWAQAAGTTEISALDRYSRRV
jgi:DNA polymerase III subunit epsilon